MLKAALPLLGFAVLLVVIVGAMVGLGRSASRQVNSEPESRKPKRPSRYSERQSAILIVTGIVGVFATLLLAYTEGGGWWLIPLALCVGMFGAIEFTAGRGKRTERAEQRKLGEAREADRLALERRLQRDRAEHRRLGKTGSATLSRARRMAKQIAATDVARTGWLGPAADYDFGPDLSALEDESLQVVQLQSTITEARALPERDAADDQLIADANAAVQKLRAAVHHRLTVIEECAREATRADSILKAERDRQEKERHRDDVRGRLGAMVYGVEITPASPPSDAVDAVKARIAAFQELKLAASPPDPSL